MSNDQTGLKPIQSPRGNSLTDFFRPNEEWYKIKNIRLAWTCTDLHRLSKTCSDLHDTCKDLAFSFFSYISLAMQMLTGNYRVQSGHREILYYAKGKISYRKNDPHNG